MEDLVWRKPVSRGRAFPAKDSFPFVAFSVPQAFQKKRRPFPLDCGFQPQAVSSSSLVPSRGGFRPEAYHPILELMLLDGGTIFAGIGKLSNSVSVKVVAARQ